MIEPIRAQIIHADWAGRVIAPPHEALTAQHREALENQNPDSFVHVTGEPSAHTPHPSAPKRLAAQAAAALSRLIAEGAYCAQDEPGLYVQQITAFGRSQRSIIGALRPSAHPLIAHETTHSARVFGLAENFTATSMMWSPVIATCPSLGELSAAIDAAVAASSPPLLDTLTSDGARITIWQLGEAAAGAVFGTAGGTADTAVGEIYIVDGHHRVAAADTAGFKQLLVALVPTEELILIGFDRLISDIDVMPRRSLEALSKLCELGEVSDRAAALPTEADTLGVGVAGRFYRAKLPGRGAVEPQPVAEFIHAEVLPALFGITEPSDPRITYRPSSLAIGASSTPNDVFEIMSPPVPVSQVLSVADRGKTMPPKSTYLVPKVRAGVMLVRF